MTGRNDSGSKNPNPQGISGCNPFDSGDAFDSNAGRTDGDFCDMHAQPFSKQQFCPIQLMQVLIDDFWKISSCLTFFCRASLVRSTCTVQGLPQQPLWPVPPFRWRWTARKNPNPRQRKRRRFHETRAKLVNLLLCTLNWETLGCPKLPPSCAQLGAPISTHQHKVIERLEALVTHFLHMPCFEGHELGRATGKFEGLINSLQELPITNVGSEDLYELLSQLHRSFDPYSSHFASSLDLHRPAQSEAKVASGSTVTVTMPSAKPVTAARVKWENPPSFEAAEYLDPLVKAAFLDPETLRLPREVWPPSKPAKMHITRSELLSLVDRWDKLGACCLIPLDSKDYSEAVGIFAVDKDAIYDRLIINPKTINSRMASLSYTTKELAPGCMLSLLSLKPGEMFRFSADDLSDYYYCFKVTPKRASRNAFRMIFDAHEVEHLSCFQGQHRGRKVLVCLATLAMGDSLAVEIGQQAHKHVLQVWAGSMKAHESLRYRTPVPRGDFIELLAIDDHVGIQRLPISDFPNNPRLRDTMVFDHAAIGYKAVGLIQHEKKRKRDQTQGTILGADFDGLTGRVMAPRERIAVLSVITLKIVQKGSCTRRLLSVLLGCWIHVMLFRRALFSVIEEVFKESMNLPQDEICALSRRALCELQVLAVLGPVAQSDLRVQHSPKLYCTDASPTGGAVIYANVGSQVTEELWRHTEQRGFYTKLQSPVAEILQEKGIEPESNAQFLSGDPIPQDSPILNKPLSEGIIYDCIELFRGEGNWSTAHVVRGFRVHDGVDISGRRLRFMDLSDRAVFHELRALALRRVCLDWHAGVPCLSYGTLRRPQVRSKSCPAGFNPDDPFTAFHNMLARRTAFLLTLVLLSGHFISVEQPGSSRLFLLHCYRVLVSLGCVISHFCFCSFGSPFQKASKWLHNKPWVLPLECQCRCRYRGQHFSAIL